jgi:hypothetical protein
MRSFLVWVIFFRFLDFQATFPNPFVSFYSASPPNPSAFGTSPCKGEGLPTTTTPYSIRRGILARVCDKKHTLLETRLPFSFWEKGWG